MTIAYHHESDNLIFMKEMTATEVARNFSAVLDSVEAGEEIVILRGKVEIARLSPAAQHVPNGAAIIDLVHSLEAAGQTAASDPDFDQAMKSVMERRQANRIARPNPWRD